jgi:hypothetical protein
MSGSMGYKKLSVLKSKTRVSMNYKGFSIGYLNIFSIYSKAHLEVPFLNMCTKVIQKPFKNILWTFEKTFFF